LTQAQTFYFLFIAFSISVFFHLFPSHKEQLFANFNKSHSCEQMLPLFETGLNQSCFISVTSFLNGPSFADQLSLCDDIKLPESKNFGLSRRILHCCQEVD
jgi:hypothetical protein